MSEVELREQIAELLYNQTASELAEFITKYKVNVRVPRSWSEKPDKEYWYLKADQILNLMPQYEPARLEALGNEETMSILRCAFTYAIPDGAFNAINNAIRETNTRNEAKGQLYRRK